jgi:hypothetical protein
MIDERPSLAQKVDQIGWKAELPLGLNVFQLGLRVTHFTMPVSLRFVCLDESAYYYSVPALSRAA